MKRLSGDGLALAAGVLYPLAFAPFFLAPLAVVCLTVLFATWAGVTPRRAAGRGFLFGFGAFGFGVSWIYISLHTYGNMPAVMTGIAVAGLVALLAAFPALAGWVQARLVPAHRPVAAWSLAMPACWVVSEWLRDWVLTGFPWLAAGYSQVGWVFANTASWLGVYGVSLITALSAGLLAAVVLRFRFAGVRGLVLLIILVATTWAAGRIVWTEPAGDPLRVALVQGNVSLIDKWAPGNAGRVRDMYFEASRGHEDRDLIVWPESALPYFFDEISENLWAALQAHPADFVVGLMERDLQTRTLHNSVAAVTDEGLQFYRKRHLVPFGEFLPMKPLFGWVIDYLNIPMADFSSWREPQKPVRAAGNLLGISVCYEDAFPLDIRRALPEATVLVNVSEDAWFGDSLAPHQRLQMAQMRALETGRPFLRAANTGISAVIDPRGLVTARSPQFERTVLTATIQPAAGVTPFARFGNIPVLVLIGVILATATLVSRRDKVPRVSA